MPTGTLLTIDEFELLPDEVAENHELVDGVLVDVSGNNPQHNSIRDLIIVIMLPFVRDRNLGTVIAEQEYEFLGNAHGPDVTFFGPDKEKLVNPMKRVQRFVPDLAIEIASPSDTYAGLLVKKDRYLRAGTREVWLIEPETREIRVYTAERVDTYRNVEFITTPLLPGLSIVLEELFGALHRV